MWLIMLFLTCVALVPWWLEYLTGFFSGMRRLSSNVARKFLKFYTVDHMMRTLLSSVVLYKHVCEDERNGLYFMISWTF